MKNFLIIIKPFAIPIVFGVFILGGLINQCSSKKAEAVYNATEMTSALNKQKLTLKTQYLQQLADSSAVIQDANKRLSDNLKPIIVYKTAKAKTSVAVARKDTNTSVVANTAIDDQETLIFDLGLKAYSDSIQLAECMRRQVINDSITSELRTAFNTEVMIGIAKDKATRKRDQVNKGMLFFGKAVVVVETVLLVLK